MEQPYQVVSLVLGGCSVILLLITVGVLRSFQSRDKLTMVFSIFLSLYLMGMLLWWEKWLLLITRSHNIYIYIYITLSLFIFFYFFFFSSNCLVHVSCRKRHDRRIRTFHPESCSIVLFLFFFHSHIIFLVSKEKTVHLKWREMKRKEWIQISKSRKSQWLTEHTINSASLCLQ